MGHRRETGGGSGAGPGLTAAQQAQLDAASANTAAIQALQNSDLAAIVPTMGDRPAAADQIENFIVRTESNGLQWRVVDGEYDPEPVTYSSYGGTVPTETIVGQRHHFPNGNVTLFTALGPQDVTSSQGPQGEPGSNRAIDLLFDDSINYAGDIGNSANVDLASAYTHIFDITESVVLTAMGWKEGASFTIDLINSTTTSKGLNWSGFDFIGHTPVTIKPDKRHVYTGKCILANDGVTQLYQIGLVGTEGSI